MERTIHLHYQVRNGLKFFEDHDELYWNVTGDEWDVPVGNASAQILLPPGVTGMRTNAFTGIVWLARAERGRQASENTVEVSMLRPLAFHEGLTVVVGWDKGFVKEPGTGDLIEQFLASNWPLFFPIPVFLFMFWLWYTRGRDPRVGSDRRPVRAARWNEPRRKPARWWMRTRPCGTSRPRSWTWPCAATSSSRKKKSRK